MINIRKEQQLL